MEFKISQYAYSYSLTRKGERSVTAHPYCVSHKYKVAEDEEKGPSTLRKYTLDGAVQPGEPKIDSLLALCYFVHALLSASFRISTTYA